MTFWPAGPTSSTSTSSEKAWLYPVRVAVTFSTEPVRPETLIDEGYGAPDPLDGMVMVAGLLNVPVPPGVVAPSVNVKLAVPRSVAPSWSWRVATSDPPQVPAAVRVKGRLTAGPAWTSTP